MPKPRSSTIPIYDGDDFEEIARLRREIDVAERQAQVTEATGRRLGDDARTPVEQLRAAYDAFVNEAADRAELWTLEPIGHAEFRVLLKAHPPRTDFDDEGKKVANAEDAQFGVNVETFGMALLTYVDPDDDEIRTVVAPEFDGEGALRRRLKRLSAGEFDTLWIRAFTLNTGGVADPKASLYSTGSRSFNAT